MPQRVFICYARADQDFALPLAEQLKARGVSVWIDQVENRVSDDWDRDIDRALRDCSHLLIVLSPASVDSREVRGELRTALDLGKTVLPVLLKPCDIPRQLRIVQFVDFTGRSPRDAVRLNEVLQALSPVLGDEPASRLGPAAPTSSPRAVAAPPGGGSPTSGRRRMTARGRRIVQGFIALLLAVGGWFALDMAMSERRLFTSASLSPDGTYLATGSYGAGRAVRVWRVSSGEVAAVISAGGDALGWSPDAKRLALGGDGSIALYDVGTWTRTTELKGPQEYVRFVAWSPDGSAIATGDGRGSLWVWDLDGAALRFTKPVHEAHIKAARWTPDGTRIATASWDRTVAIVNARDGAVLRRLEGHTSHVQALAFSPDGMRLASGALESPPLIVWDTDGRGHHLPHGTSVEGVEWSKDGRYLASIGTDALVHVWDPDRYELFRRFALAGSYTAGTSVSWSSNGKWLAAADVKGVQILDPGRDLPVRTLPDPSDERFQARQIVGWSADMARLAVLADSRTVRIWDVTNTTQLRTFRVGLWRALLLR